MRGRLTTIVQRYGDALLAAAIALIALAQISSFDESAWLRLAATAFIAPITVAAALRVRFPLVFIGLLAATLPVGALLPTSLPDIEAMGLYFFLAVYSAAAHTDGGRTLAAAALTVALGLAAMLGDPEEINLAAIVFFSVVTAGPWVAGRIVHRRRVNEERLEREKAAAEAAIAEERARIARELHDVVAHAISVIVLQARGGRKVIDDAPDEARKALDAIERTATQALGEMRTLLGLLRESDDELALGPQPTLARIDELVERVRSAGLPVELAIEGDPVDIPPGVDLSAYRIVQEALTNALKHAGPATARVTVRYADGELGIDVSDDGGGGANGDGSGHGLHGIRERVAVFGGEVEAGARPDGGYAVRARLPYSTER